jgi:NADPH-dependent glutamate synthase beta subunit-like oxidoreductase
MSATGRSREGHSALWPAESSGKKVAIIGGGPAGLAAAYFLRAGPRRPRSSTTDAELGGMMRYGIPGYRTPRECSTHESSASSTWATSKCA